MYLKKSYLLVFGLMLAKSVIGQIKSQELPSVIMKAVEMINMENKLTEAISDKKCNIVLLNPDYKFDYLVTDFESKQVCLLSKKEMFVYNIKNYVELTEYDITKKRATLKFSVFEGIEKKNEFNFNLRKRRGQWVLR